MITENNRKNTYGIQLKLYSEEYLELFYFKKKTPTNPEKLVDKNNFQKNEIKKI